MAANGLKQDDDNNFVAVRILISGSEILSLVDNFGERLRHIRIESGARISVSDGSVKDRVVTFTGSYESIHKSILLTLEAFEQFLACVEKRDIRKNPYTLKLMVPSTQCGPLIGKGGSKIREMRDLTGTSLQVDSDILPNSAERIVNITGKSEAIADCVMHITNIVNTKASVGLYQPWLDEIKGPLVFSKGKVYTVQGNLVIPVDNELFNRLMKHPTVSDYLKKYENNSSDNKKSASDKPTDNAEQNSTENINRNNPNTITDEIWIFTDLIGCIIGPGGCKAEEIRQITGATVYVDATEKERSTPAGYQRRIRVQGTNESVTLAKYLISLCTELEMVLTQRNRPDADQLPPVLETIAKSGMGSINNLVNITSNSTITDVITMLGISGLFASTVP